MTFRAGGDYTEAERLYRQALASRRKLFGDEHVRKDGSLHNLIEVLVLQNKFDEVGAVLGEFITPATINRPESYDLLSLYTELLARHGLWEEAAAGASRVLELRPENAQQYHTLAPLLVASKNLAGYQQICRRIVARFSGTTDVFTADKMAKDCLILQSAGVDLEPVAAMAETAVAAGRREAPYPFFECCKALAEYRQGHYEGAAKWAQEAAKKTFP